MKARNPDQFIPLLDGTIYYNFHSPPNPHKKFSKPAATSHWILFDDASKNKIKISTQNYYLKQAWAKIIYMRAMIYLNMKKFHARAENLYNSPVYSLDFYSSTKIFLGPTRDLQTGLIVLGEDLAICQ
jgi:hypothetical protein